MPDVARHFWGEPNPRHSNKKELRWGTNGARSVDVAKGTWFDHEAKRRRRRLDFLKREGVRRILAMAAASTASATPDNGRAKRAKIVATYDYTDESGALLFQVVRLEPKTFRQRRPAARRPRMAGSGTSRASRAGSVYRLPELDRGARARASRVHRRGREGR